MEFKLDTNINKKLMAVQILHRGESATFNLSLYNKISSLTNVEEVMTPINDFVSRMSDEEQTTLFEVYAQLATLSLPGNSLAKYDLLHDLDSATRRIFGVVHLENLFNYASVYSKFHIPPMLTAPQEVYHKDTTYSVEEYRGLMGLTLVAKLMLPIWGQFIPILTDVVGKTQREYIAVGMLKHTGLPESVEYQRLLRYIQNTRALKNEFTMPSAMIFSGFVEEDLGEYLLSMVMVRKLTIAETTIGEIQKEQGTTQNNLVGSINSYIDSQLRNRALINEFGGDIRELEHPRERQGSEENNTSISESYLAKQRVSDFHGVNFNVYCEDRNLERLVGQVDPSMSMALVEEFKQHILSIHLDMTEGKYFIMAAILTSEIIPTEGVEALNFESVCNVMAIACAYLHQRKLYDIVKYLLAKRVPLDATNMSAEQRQAQDGKFADETLKALLKYYTHQFNDTKEITITTWIYTFTREEVCDFAWEEQSPSIATMPGFPEYRRNVPYYAHRDFKNLLAYLLVYCNQRLEDTSTNTATNGEQK